MFPPKVGLSRLRALACTSPVVIFPLASRVISPEPSGERELILPELLFIEPFLLVRVILPATPRSASPCGLGMKVKLLLLLNSSLSLKNPDARSISMSPTSIDFSEIIYISPESPSLAPENTLAVPVLRLLSVSNIISPPFPGLALLLFLPTSEAEIILLF